jgi:hypothetical protein
VADAGIAAEGAPGWYAKKGDSRRVTIAALPRQ